MIRNDYHPKTLYCRDGKTKIKNQAQQLAFQLWRKRGYTASLENLGLGIAEEAGELCKAINLISYLYKPKPGTTKHEIEHEIYDCLVYLYHIANRMGIEIKFEDYLRSELENKNE